MTGSSALDLWEAGLTMTPAARAVLLLGAAGHAEVADWPVGRRDQALLRSYCPAGRALDAVADCPACGAVLDVVIEPRDLIPPPSGDAPVTVDFEAYRVVVRVPTAGDLEQLTSHAPIDALRNELLQRCVLEVSYDGNRISVDGLPEVVVTAVEEALEEADPGADLRLSMACIECAAEWTEDLDPVRFAWTAIESAARQLATDVHTLAQAYGWSEPEVLALSPFRRHLYLSAVQP